MQEQKGERFFLSLKIFLWNGGKSVKGWIGEPWGAEAGRLLQGVNIMEPWFPSLYCLKAVWGLPKKFSLFCGFWENLKHRFNKKMDVWITSFKQTRSLCPSAFTVGKKNSLTKLSEAWRQASGPAPPLPLQWGRSTGESRWNEVWCLKCEERLSKAWKDQSATRTRTWKPEGKGVWMADPREKGRTLYLLQLSLTISDSEVKRTVRGRQSHSRGSPGEVRPSTPPPSLWNAAPHQPCLCKAASHSLEMIGESDFNWWHVFAKFNPLPLNYFENFASHGQKPQKGKDSRSPFIVVVF